MKNVLGRDRGVGMFGDPRIEQTCSSRSLLRLWWPITSQQVGVMGAEQKHRESPKFAMGKKGPESQPNLPVPMRRQQKNEGSWCERGCGEAIEAWWRQWGQSGRALVTPGEGKRQAKGWKWTATPQWHHGVHYTELQHWPRGKRGGGDKARRGEIPERDQLATLNRPGDCS